MKTNLHFSVLWLMSVMIVLIKFSSQFVFGIFTNTFNVQKIYQVTEGIYGFVELKPIDAETISGRLLVNVRNWGFDLTKLRRQGYDGCSTMSCEVSGVKTRITEELSDAKYFMHCRSHCLNLMIVNSCPNVPVI